MRISDPLSMDVAAFSLQLMTDAVEKVDTFAPPSRAIIPGSVVHFISGIYNFYVPLNLRESLLFHVILIVPDRARSKARSIVVLLVSISLSI